MSKPVLLIAAGGTGGHIMPGLAVAQALQQAGWAVVWMGHPERMEGRLVPKYGIKLQALRFSGVRGHGIFAWLKLPFTLSHACWQAFTVFRKIKPQVLLGLGGYVAFPAGLTAAMCRIPLVIHEQNAIAGTANRWLARLSSKTLSGFPGALPNALVVGNPVREELLHMEPSLLRYTKRKGPLQVLVIGGSLGAQVLNTVMPQALALMPKHKRPVVIHQAGEQHLQALQNQYEKQGIQAQCHAFIDDMAQALAWADMIICRAGAMTVSEVAAAGVAALFIPLPHAIDDHQTANANYLAHCQAAWLCPQSQFTAEWLADWLLQKTREQLTEVAQHAHQHARLQATAQIAQACIQTAGEHE